MEAALGITVVTQVAIIESMLDAVALLEEAITAGLEKHDLSHTSARSPGSDLCWPRGSWPKWGRPVVLPDCRDAACLSRHRDAYPGPPSDPAMSRPTESATKRLARACHLRAFATLS